MQGRLAMARTLVRLLTLRLDREGYTALGVRQAWAGLILAAIAGVARYWHDPSAAYAQKFGGVARSSTCSC
jgi:hypothetical protein